MWFLVFHIFARLFWRARETLVKQPPGSVPVFKKGRRCEPGNYRPVSLTCVMCKLMEHIICTHIRSHLDRHGILTYLNHGFRSRHSCESQLIFTTHDFLVRMDQKGEEADILVLDFSKAFNTVPHKRLLHKLEFYGKKQNPGSPVTILDGPSVKMFSAEQ